MRITSRAVARTSRRSNETFRKDLERGHTDDVGTFEEEAGQRRDLVDVAVVDGRVEDDRDPEPAGPFDVLLPHGLEVVLARGAGSLLCRVDMKRDVEETGLRQLGQEISSGSDTVREERGPKAGRSDAPDDRNELASVAESGVASGHLDADAGPEPLPDLVDPPVEDVERHVGHRPRDPHQVLIPLSYSRNFTRNEGSIGGLLFR
jgi:hypothetical protein